jgi:hypothetical protein
MDSEEINSINDTVEAQQVVDIIKTTYDDIIARTGPQIFKKPFNLVSLSNPAWPTLMVKPDNVSDIEWIKYDKRLVTETIPNWEHVNFIPFDNFINYAQQNNTDQANVGVMTLPMTGGFSMDVPYTNNRAPSCWTTFDDISILFDSYDSAIDDTLQSIKTLCYGSRNLTFQKLDSFVPELADDQFPLLLNEAKSLAWAELKQTPHAKAEQTARRNWTHVSKERKHVVNPGSFYGGGHTRLDGPNFGRK